MIKGKNMNKIDYSNSITNLSNSILKHFGVEPFHKTIPEIDKKLDGKKKVIVFLFDAMGKSVLEKHLDEYSFFRTHIIKNITSTIPPTTVASTTSFLSGKFPIETGWLGWTLYFNEIDKNVNVFPNVDDDTGELIMGEHMMNKTCPYKNIAALINEKTNKEIAHLIYGYPVDKKNKKVRRLKGFIKHAYKIANKNDESFTYAYWVNPDGLMHGRGVNDKKVHKNILKIQKYIQRYSLKNKDVATLVIADHGMIDVNFLDMYEHSDLVNTLKRNTSIEKRMMNFFIKDGQQDEFKKLFNKYYGQYYTLLSKEKVLKENLFGEGLPHKKSLEFIGDFIGLANSDISLQMKKQKDEKNPFVFKAHHAGNTLDEMLISVIGINL